jgi:hypothetical protein
MEQSEFVRRLKDLSELHANGVLTDEEFGVAKEKFLGEPVSFDLSDSRQGRPENDHVDPGSTSNRSGVGWPTGRGASFPSLARGVGPVPVWTGHSGAITSGIGGLVTLMAFLAMPMATFPLVGSMTGPTVAGYSAQLGALGCLWLVPLAAAAVTGIAAWQVIGTSLTMQARRIGSIALMVLAGLVVVDYIVVLTAVQYEIDSVGSRASVSATAFTGAGFWIALIGMAASLIGAGLEIRSHQPITPDNTLPGLG